MTNTENDVLPVKELFGDEWQDLSFNERVAAIAAFKLYSEDKDNIRDFVKDRFQYSLYNHCHSMLDVANEYLEGGGYFNDPLVAKYFDVESFADDWESESRNCEVDYQDEDGDFCGWFVWG